MFEETVMAEIAFGPKTWASTTQMENVVCRAIETVKISEELKDRSPV